MHTATYHPICYPRFSQFFSGRIHGLHRGSQLLLIIVHQLHFWMWHGKKSVVPGGFSEDNISGVELQVFANPFLSPKPHQFHFSGIINEVGHQALAFFLFHRTQVHDLSNDLDFRRISFQFRNFIKAGFVEVTVGKKIQQVAISVNANLLSQDICPVGTNAFKVINGSLQQVGIHRTKIKKSLLGRLVFPNLARVVYI